MEQIPHLAVLELHEELICLWNGSKDCYLSLKQKQNPPFLLPLEMHHGIKKNMLFCHILNISYTSVTSNEKLMPKLISTV